MIDQNILTNQEDNEESNGSKILILLCAVVFFVVANAVMINIARPSIGNTFGMGERTMIILTWIVTGYMLSFGIFNTIDGRLADVFGVRRVFMIGTAILGLTAFIMGFSPTLDFIIGFRVLQGCGAAALPALSTAIIARVIPPQKRGWAMGTIVATTGVASVAGLFLGGALVQGIGWRAVFFFTSLVLFSLPIAAKVLPKSLDKTSGAKFDLPGAIFLALGVGSLFYSFVFVEQSVRAHAADADYAAFQPEYLIFPAVGIFFILVFTYRIKHTSDPLVPAFLFRNKSYIAAAITTAFANTSRFGAYVMVPQLLAKVFHVAPIKFALVLLPGELAIFFFSSKFGKFADKHGSTYPVVFGSICLIGSNLLFAFQGTQSIIALTIAMGFYGLGLTAVQTPLMSSVSKILPRQLTGVGMGIFMMLFFIGGGIGSAIWNTAFALQSPDSASWIGVAGDGIRYSNSVLIIGVLPLLGVLLVPLHPKRDAEQIVVGGAPAPSAALASAEPVKEEKEAKVEDSTPSEEKPAEEAKISDAEVGGSLEDGGEKGENLENDLTSSDEEESSEEEKK